MNILHSSPHEAPSGVPADERLTPYASGLSIERRGVRFASRDLVGMSVRHQFTEVDWNRLQEVSEHQARVAMGQAGLGPQPVDLRQNTLEQTQAPVYAVPRQGYPSYDDNPYMEMARSAIGTDAAVGPYISSSVMPIMPENPNAN